MLSDSALTPREVADMLKIAKNTVYTLIKRGELMGYKVGNKVRVDLRDVEEYKTRKKEQQQVRSERRLDLPDRGADLNRNPAADSEVDWDGGFIICGQDVILDILSRYLEAHPEGRRRILRSYIGSYNGLYALYQGKVHVATAHMWDGDTDQYNVPYVAKMLPGTPALIINLVARLQGFHVAKGNPKHIESWRDLTREDILIVNREKGSGVRILLDERLRKMGVATSQVKGYDRECSTHLAVASAVARGEADVGIGNEKTGLQVKNIDFLPIQKEKYDLIIKKEDLEKPIYQAVIEIIRSKSFQDEIEGLGGYDLAQTGEIIAET